MRKWIVLSFLAGGAGLILVSTMQPYAARPVPAAMTAKPAAAALPTAARRFTAGPGAAAAPAGDPEIDRIFGPLRQAVSDEAAQQAQTAAYFEILAQLKTNPGLIGKLEALLATGDRHKPEVRVAVGALAGAGTAEAQAALVRLVDARKDDGGFLELLVPTMAFAERPSPALEGALRKLADGEQPRDVRVMAHLAVGATAGHLQADDPERARRIVEDYDAKLTRSTSSDDVTTYLSALGNAGTTEAAAVVERYLGDRRREVRAHAVEALRRVETPEAEAEIMRVLREDGDADVRTSAVWALSQRQPSAERLQAEGSALVAERSQKVAERLLEEVWAGGEGARAIVTGVAASHPLPAIRERARALLASAQ